MWNLDRISPIVSNAWQSGLRGAPTRTAGDQSVHDSETVAIGATGGTRPGGREGRTGEIQDRAGRNLL
jgi:hypothetical protein